MNYLRSRACLLKTNKLQSNQVRLIGGSGKIGRERKTWDRVEGIKESIAYDKQYITNQSNDPWMKVRYRGLDPIERKFTLLARSEDFRSDADEARSLSDHKMERLKQSLLTKG